MIKLTKREIEVAELVIQGYTSKQIAEILVVSIHTINKHMENLYRKLSLDNFDFKAFSVKRLKLAFAFIKLHYNISFHFMVSNPFYL